MKIFKRILIGVGAFFILMVLLCWMEAGTICRIAGAYHIDNTYIMEYPDTVKDIRRPEIIRMSLALREDNTGFLYENDSIIPIIKWKPGWGDKFYVMYADSTKETFHRINDSIIVREKVIRTDYKLHRIKTYDN